MTLGRCFFFYLKAVFFTVNIYSFFLITIKLLTKTALKNYFSVSGNVLHTHSVDVS